MRQIVAKVCHVCFRSAMTKSKALNGGLEVPALNLFVSPRFTGRGINECRAVREFGPTALPLQYYRCAARRLRSFQSRLRKVGGGRGL